MLTVDFDRLGLRPGERVLDLGCGAGRHAFEMYRRGADVIAFDQDADELAAVRESFAAMRDAGEVPAGAEADVKEGDALALPFADGEFDRVVAAEILEHVPDDVARDRGARPGAPARRHASPSPCRAGCPRRSAGSSRAPTTTSRAATSASTPSAELSRQGRAAGLVLERARPRPRPARAVLVAQVRRRGRRRRPPARPRLPPAAGLGDHEAARACSAPAGRVLDPLIGKSLVLYFRKPGSVQRSDVG